MLDQIFVARKMVRADVAIAMETETESFVDGAERFCDRLHSPNANTNDLEFLNV